jgi:hypothetical protein
MSGSEQFAGTRTLAHAALEQATALGEPAAGLVADITQWLAAP